MYVVCIRININWQVWTFSEEKWIYNMFALCCTLNDYYYCSAALRIALIFMNPLSCSTVPFYFGFEYVLSVSRGYSLCISVYLFTLFMNHVPVFIIQDKCQRDAQMKRNENKMKSAYSRRTDMCEFSQSKEWNWIIGRLAVIQCRAAVSSKWNRRMQNNW